MDEEKLYFEKNITVFQKMIGWDLYTFFVRAVFRISATLEIYFLVREMGPFPSRVDF